jgi:hypothetical protein
MIPGETLIEPGEIELNADCKPVHCQNPGPCLA